jgi:membrane protein YqaA with SNARE-associated domain
MAVSFTETDYHQFTYQSMCDRVLVVKAFLTSEAMANQLLNSAITIAGTTLGAVLGYFLGKNSGSKSSD